MASKELLSNLTHNLKTKAKQHYKKLENAFNEITLTLTPEQLMPLAKLLKQNAAFDFDMLLDVCGVDYLHYGQSEWSTTPASDQGFSRARMPITINESACKKGRFAAVYHLLSLKHRHRIRLIVRLHEKSLCLPSVYEIWPSANWFEREAFDLFGIEFEGHPDLRRILTDYGFTGHPLRKDFPVHGQIEMRYDAAAERCIYEPVAIQPRNVIPKTIRQDDSRHLHKDLYEPNEA
jgi:NADH-quinone oxidoreductase subunit C